MEKEEETYKVITFRIREDIWKTLKEISASNHRSISGQVVLFVEKGLNNGNVC